MEFFNYFKALQYAPKAKSYPIALFVTGYLICFFNMYLGSVCFWVTLLASFALISGLSISYWVQSRPNLEAVFPINHKKKLLYRFSSSLFMTLIMIVAVIIIMLISVSLSLIIIFAIGGDTGWTSEDTLELTEIFFKPLGVYGGLFSAAYFIIMYSAGMITSFIEKRKHRNIFLICLCIGVVLSNFFMCLPYFIANQAVRLISPIYNVCYEAMGVPWLSTVFWFIVAAAMLGAAIYMGIKHYDPKKF